MECTKDKLYFLVETLRRNHKKGTEIHEIMQNAWPEDCLSVRQIQRLCKEYEDGNRYSFERKEGQGRPVSDLRHENIEAVSNLIAEDNTITLRRIANLVHLSFAMVQRIVTEDLKRKWLHTKWVPHTLTEQNKAVRVERCLDLIEALSVRLCAKNLVTIDEKFFYLRNLRPRNTIGCWIDPSGDTVRAQTARRSAMEKKVFAVVAVTQQGQHYFEVLPSNTSLNSEKYISFIKNMAQFLRNCEPYSTGKHAFGSR